MSVVKPRATQDGSGKAPLAGPSIQKPRLSGSVDGGTATATHARNPQNSSNGAPTRGPVNDRLVSRTSPLSSSGSKARTHKAHHHHHHHSSSSSGRSRSGSRSSPLGSTEADHQLQQRAALVLTPSSYKAPPPVFTSAVHLSSGGPSSAAGGPRFSTPLTSPKLSSSQSPSLSAGGGSGVIGARHHVSASIVTHRRRTSGRPEAHPASVSVPVQQQQQQSPLGTSDRGWQSALFSSSVVSPSAVSHRLSSTVPIIHTPSPPVASTTTATAVHPLSSSTIGKRTPLTPTPLRRASGEELAQWRPWLLPPPSKGILRVPTPPTPSHGGQPPQSARGAAEGGGGTRAASARPSLLSGSVTAGVVKLREKHVQFDEDSLRASGCGSSQVYTDSTLGFSLSGILLDDVNRSPTTQPSPSSAAPAAAAGGSGSGVGGGGGVVTTTTQVTAVSAWDADSEWFNEQFGIAGGAADGKAKAGPSLLTPSCTDPSASALSPGAAVAAAAAAAIAASSPPLARTASANSTSVGAAPRLQTPSPSLSPSSSSSPALHSVSTTGAAARKRQYPPTPRRGGDSGGDGSGGGAHPSEMPATTEPSSVSLVSRGPGGASLGALSPGGPSAGKDLSGLPPPPPLSVEDLRNSEGKGGSGDGNQDGLQQTPPTAVADLTASERRLLRALVRVNQRREHLTAAARKEEENDFSEPLLGEWGSRERASEEDQPQPRREGPGGATRSGSTPASGQEPKVLAGGGQRGTTNHDGSGLTVPSTALAEVRRSLNLSVGGEAAHHSAAKRKTPPEEDTSVSLAEQTTTTTAAPGAERGSHVDPKGSASSLAAAPAQSVVAGYAAAAALKTRENAAQGNATSSSVKRVSAGNLLVDSDAEEIIPRRTVPVPTPQAAARRNKS